MNMPPPAKGGKSVIADFLQYMLEMPIQLRQHALSEALSIWCPECGKSHELCTCEAEAYNSLGMTEEDLVAHPEEITSATPTSTVLPNTSSSSASAVAAGGIPPGFQGNPFAAAGEVESDADEDDMSIDMTAFRNITSGPPR